MSALDHARWQFGIVTVYHFLFVRLTIGLSILAVSMQTAWLVKKYSAYLRMTKFSGNLFLINFAVGVITGIVQEFQFVFRQRLTRSDIPADPAGAGLAGPGPGWAGDGGPGWQPQPVPGQS